LEYSVTLGDKVLPGSNVVMCKLATGRVLHFNRGMVSDDASFDEIQAADKIRRLSVSGVMMPQGIARGLSVDGYILSPNPLASKAPDENLGEGQGEDSGENEAASTDEEG